MILLLLACSSAWEVMDLDSDGLVYGRGDCDETDPLTHARARERCDGLDNDCDGLIDEALSEDWYLDRDQDGWGVGDPVEVCRADRSYAARVGDCDDADPENVPASKAEACD